MALIMLVDGHIPDAGVQWFEGLLIILAIASVIVGFIAVIKGMNKAAKEEFNEQLEKKESEIKRDVVIDQTLNGLKDSLDRLSQSIYEMRGDISTKVNDIEKRVACQENEIVKIDQAVKSAHKRIDEHRKIDHGYNSRTRLSDEKLSEHDKEE